jgi:Rrf2 family iron-responsive transcriptional regulator
VKFTLQGKTDLAIRTLNVLAESGIRWRASELAGAIDSTPEFIPQVLAPLVRAGWVESRRGPTGGYRLQSTAISVRDVIEAVEGPIDTAGCVLRGVPCGTDGNCALHGAWSKALDALLRELGHTPARSNSKENGR